MDDKMRPVIYELPEGVLDIIAGNLSLDSLLGLCSTHPNLALFPLKREKWLKLRGLPTGTQEYLKRHGGRVKVLDVSSCMALPSVLMETMSNCKYLNELNMVGTSLSCKQVVWVVEELKHLQTLSFSFLYSRSEAACCPGIPFPPQLRGYKAITQGTVPSARGHPYESRRSSQEDAGILERLKQFHAMSSSLLRPIYRAEQNFRFADVETQNSTLNPLSGRKFPQLKKLYIEIVGDPSSSYFVIDFMNRCDALEEARIHVITKAAPEDMPVYLPRSLALSADRRDKLRTFILTISSPKQQTSPWYGGFAPLLSLFGNDTDERPPDWAQYPKQDYIYENRRVESTSDARISEQLQMATLGSTSESLPSGSPEKLRVVCSLWSGDRAREIFENAHPWNAALVELDLSNSHVFFSVRFWNLDSSFLPPSLRALALPSCFFKGMPSALDEKDSSPDAEAKQRAALALFDAHLRKLHLEKFSLQGRQEYHCCRDVSFTSLNMPDLRSLQHLKEIIISDARLDDSAYKMVANPNMHTLKMHTLLPDPGPPLTPRYMKTFFILCRNLRNLSLDLRSLPRQSYLWASLVEIECLKQLCLELPKTLVEDVRIFAPEKRELVRNISRVAEKIEVAHIHFSLRFVGAKGFRSFYLHDIVRDKLFSRPNDAGIVREFVGPDEKCLARDDSLEGPPTYYGRGLCTPESFIARIEPIGWNAD